MGWGGTGRRTKILIAVALVPLMPGCSIAFVHGPGTSRTTSPGPEPECTSSAAAPIADTIIVGLELATFGYLQSRSVEEREQSKVWFGSDTEAAALVAGAATAFSMIYGYRTTYECRQLVAAARPYTPPGRRPVTRQERAAEEAAEEAAVEAQQRDRAAADAKAAGEAAKRVGAGRSGDQPATAP